MTDNLRIDGLYDRMIEVTKIALNEALQNVHDPNTEPDKARKVTVTIELKPSKDRSMISSKVQAKVTKVPASPVEMALMTGKDLKTGEVFMKDLVSNMGSQIDIDEYEDTNADIDMETGEILSFKQALGGAK